MMICLKQPQVGETGLWMKHVCSDLSDLASGCETCLWVRQVYGDLSNLASGGRDRSVDTCLTQPEGVRQVCGDIMLCVGVTFTKHTGLRLPVLTTHEGKLCDVVVIVCGSSVTPPPDPAPSPVLLLPGRDKRAPGRPPLSPRMDRPRGPGPRPLPPQGDRWVTVHTSEHYTTQHTKTHTRPQHTPQDRKSVV